MTPWIEYWVWSLEDLTLYQGSDAYCVGKSLNFYLP